MHFPKSVRRFGAFALLLFSLSTLAQGDTPAIDRLIGEQKYAEALKRVQAEIDASKGAKKEMDWAKLVAQEAMLQVGLHGYEKAVRTLADRQWPGQPLPDVLIRIIYAKSLQTYYQSYSWEIRKRERVETKEKVDLKSMTSEQIYQEATRAMMGAWSKRESLGKHPKTALGELILPNRFPENIRGTLRDSATYLFSELLADTSGWTPAQANEAYLLDILRLLASTGTKEADLLRESVHPLEKIAYLLNDLSRWHASAGRRDAALEARLELYRHLHSSFTDENARTLLRQRLTKDLESSRKVPWVTMGYATLAEFVREEPASDSLPRSRKIALEGAALHPQSPGAAKCRSIVASIEQPAYELEGMRVDGPNRRSLGVQYKNLRRLHFRSYAFDLESFLRNQKDYSFRPQGRELDSLATAKPSFEWAQDLPETIDYRLHRAYSMPPAHPPGFYVVYASAHPTFEHTDNSILGIHFFSGDLALTIHSGAQDGKLEVQVASASRGDAAPGVEVALYGANYQKGHEFRGSKKTGADGLVKFDVTHSLFSRRDSGMFLIARKGRDLVASSHAFHMSARSAPPEISQSFVYTDRSIYRPGQKILWKVVAFGGKSESARYAIAPKAKLKVVLRDANHETLQTIEAVTNPYGSASGEFTIPAGKLLGHWTVSTDRDGSTGIRVEEYKRPTFEVEFANEAAVYRLNREATIEGTAKYYFGSPVTAGVLQYSVHRSIVLPWWCFWGRWDWSGYQREQIVARGKTKLDAGGKFKIRFLPKADENLARAIEGLRYRYRVQADVTDEGGETRGKSDSFAVGFTAVSAELQLATPFFRVGNAPEITVRRTDLRGKPLAGKGTWKLFRLEQPQNTVAPADLPMPAALQKISKLEFRSPDDAKLPRWDHRYNALTALREWPDAGSVASGEISGDGKAAIPTLPEGAYRIRYETRDSFGTAFDTQKEFFVATDQARFRLPGFFSAEKHSVPVGGKIRLLAFSGYEDQRMTLETYRAGALLSRRVLVSGKQPSLVEIPVTDADRGGMSFVLRVIRDHQLMEFQESVMVPWDQKELKVEFATFRDKLRPGAQETWSLKLSGPNGEKIAPAAAEVLAYMYDRSLDSFLPHLPVNPLSIYPSRTGAAYAVTELGEAPGTPSRGSGFRHPPSFADFQPDRVQFYPRYGIGGPGSRGSRREMFAAGGMANQIASLADSEDGAPAMQRAKKSLGAAMVAKEENAPSESRTAASMSPDAPAPAVELRSNFSETAFWKPHLIPDSDGSIRFQFDVPDSVTSWQVWAHAITKDLMAGRTQRETKTVKELLVRPYLPRFLREGDEAELKMVVSNTSTKEIAGKLDFDILDPDTQKSLLKDFAPAGAVLASRDFRVAGGGSSTQTFAVRVPARVGMIAVKATATAGNLSDGELRPVPVLPGRFHLMQSRFAALKGNAKRELDFPDLRKSDDPTRIQERLVLTLDAQLFYGVLSALPYLLRYPYESTDQTVNRFVSTGIVNSVFLKFPSVAAMAKEFSSRKTALETWDEPDPNRKLALEETPWLAASRGGDAHEKDLIRVLDPKISAGEQGEAMRDLRKSQTSLGGFPWFPGGPPSPYITLSALYGFSKALEFGVDVPKPMVQNAWAYLHRHYIDELLARLTRGDHGIEFVTFMNYVLSNFPDASWSNRIFSAEDRRKMLEASFRHWKEHSPYLKGYLALTLAREKRPADAKLVWDSVMDSAKTTPNEGTHWAAEDRSWLWYNDTIETHAFALRAGTELGTKPELLDGMVQWLFLNKKLNHWKSTRATAEVLYSLIHYLTKTNQLGVAEKATVKLGGDTLHFAFEPDRYTGKKNQVIVPAAKIGPSLLPIVVEKSGAGHLFASATWHYSTEKMPDQSRGDFLRVERAYFKRSQTAGGARLSPLAEGARIEIGDEVEVHLSLRSKHPLQYVHLKDPRAAGFEPVDTTSRHRGNLGVSWYEEIRDSGTNFFFESLPTGEYPFTYRLRATTAGNFKASPATVQPMYAPEFAAFSSGRVLRIEAPR